MSALAQYINTTPDARTQNGAETYSTSKNPVIDLFFLIGGASLKTTSMSTLVTLFEDAYQYDEERAIRILFWLRDIRGGAGRREIFRQLMKHLERNRPQVAMKFLQYVPEFGRWDDLLIFETQEVKTAAYTEVAKGLIAKNGLCAKWMDRKGPIARELREFLKLTPKQYRKLLVNLTNVVETQMCDNKWTDIDFSHVPSLASIRYAKAFNRHDPMRYAEFKAKVETGEVKVNTGALYPHDVVVSLRKGDQQLANGMWNQLPNYVGDANILAIADVSGSMFQQIQGDVTALDVSISLAMYTASKNTGPFANMFMTFTDRASFVTLNPKQTLQSMYERTARAPWGMSTNLQSAFELILDTAVKANASQADMPEMVLILSDMEFNQCTGRSTNFQAIEAQYKQAGYKMPKLVFWNLCSRVGNVPVQYNEDGVGLVSGYSPSLLKNVLKADDFNPQSIVDAVIMTDRYSVLFE